MPAQNRIAHCLFTSLIACLLFFTTQAQPPGLIAKIDSLKKELPGLKNDSNKVIVLNIILKFYVNADPEQGISYGEQAATLAEKINYKTGMAAAYNSLGTCHKNMSNYPRALEYYFKSLKVNETLGDKLNIARNTGNIGSIYSRLKKYDRAMEYFNKALEVNKTLDRKFGIINNLSDMAIIYSETGDNTTSLEYLDRALKIAIEIDDKEGQAIIYGNIGNVYNTLRKYSLAIENFQKSRQINEELNRIVGIAINNNSLGEMYYLLATDTSKSPDHAHLSARERDANLKKSIDYYKKAIPMFSEMGALDYMYANYNSLAAAYLADSDYRNAFNANIESHKLKDSIYSTDNKLKLANLTVERAELEKKQQQKLTRLAQNKRRSENLLFSVVILLISVFSVFVVRARRRSEKLLLNILPRKVAQELKQKGSSAARNFDNVTVLFTDFVNFTSAAEKMDPKALVHELDTCFKAFDSIMARYGIEKIKTVGDAYVAVAGLPEPDSRHAENVVRAALEIIDFNANRKRNIGDATFEIRVGINSGSVVAGIVGATKFAYDIWGDTVNTASRMEQNCDAGKINISQTTYDLVKDKFTCEYRGEIEAKNKGMMKMYYISGPKGQA